MDLSKRLPGPDVVRAVAMFGVVVMNYHGYLVIRGGQLGDGQLDRLFDPWTGPLSTRFAATFVLTAGIGVTLMTRSSIGDPGRVLSFVPVEEYVVLDRAVLHLGEPDGWSGARTRHGPRDDPRVGKGNCRSRESSSSLQTPRRRFVGS